MFEYNNIDYSLDDLQKAASNKGMPFDSYLSAMKQRGLKEKEGNMYLEQQTEVEKQENVSWFDQSWLGRGIA